MSSGATARWTLPRYFEYDIVNGPASTSVEWIRVYVPGPWQPVAESTLGPATYCRIEHTNQRSRFEAKGSGENMEKESTTQVKTTQIDAAIKSGTIAAF